MHNADSKKRQVFVKAEAKAIEELKLVAFGASQVRQTDFQISNFVCVTEGNFAKVGTTTSVGIWLAKLDSLKQHVFRRRRVDHVASMFASKFILPFFIFCLFIHMFFVCFE